jgi:hypothetical protein
MTVRGPGRPEDLPSAEVIWARWAVLAAPRADRPGYGLDEDGLHLDTLGRTRAATTWVGEGRAVLFGDDEAGGTKWHEPPIACSPAPRHGYRTSGWTTTSTLDQLHALC